MNDNIAILKNERLINIKQSIRSAVEYIAVCCEPTKESYTIGKDLLDAIDELSRLQYDIDNDVPL